MRIADQVIEEVDEQLTVHSTRAQDNKRPTAQSIFATFDERQPMRSDPIDVPATHHNVDIGYDRAQSVMQPEHHPYIFPNNAIFSTSAPEENTTLNTPTINIEKDASPKFNKSTHIKPICTFLISHMHISYTRTLLNNIFLF